VNKAASLVLVGWAGCRNELSLCWRSTTPNDDRFDAKQVVFLLHF
jgi:hypothetical protein